MLHNFYLISVYTAALANIILFIFSVVYCYRGFNPTYLRSFPVYCLVNLMVEVVAYSKNNYSDGYVSNAVSYNFFTIFEIIYLSFFLTQFIRSRICKALVLILNGFYFFHLIRFISRFGLTHMDTGGYFIECFTLIIPCLFYFKELFSKQRSPDITKEPSFWIVTAFLFSFSLAIPTLLFSGYFEFRKMKSISDSLFAINDYAQMISTIIIIKGFRCRIKRSY